MEYIGDISMSDLKDTVLFLLLASTLIGVLIFIPVERDRQFYIKGKIDTLHENLLSDIKRNTIDPIVIRIDSQGGRLDIGFKLYEELKEREGKVTMIVDGQALSMAALLLCAADEVRVSLMDDVMFHLPSIEGKKRHEITDEERQVLEYYTRKIVKIMDTDCKSKNLIRHDTIKRMLSGEDVYVN